MLVVGDYGEVVLVGVNEEGVGIKDVGGGFVYWDVCYWYNFFLVFDNWYYVIGVFIFIVGIIGILGNVIVIYIFSMYVWFLLIEVY